MQDGGGFCLLNWHWLFISSLQPWTEPKWLQRSTWRTKHCTVVSANLVLCCFCKNKPSGGFCLFLDPTMWLSHYYSPMTLHVMKRSSSIVSPTAERDLTFCWSPTSCSWIFTSSLQSFFTVKLSTHCSTSMLTMAATHWRQHSLKSKLKPKSSNSSCWRTTWRVFDQAGNLTINHWVQGHWPAANRLFFLMGAGLL